MRKLAAIAFIVTVAAAFAARADDDTALRQSLLKLGESEAPARKEAMLTLARTGDPRIGYTLAQFRLESLFIWSNTVVQCGGFSTDNFAPLNDALSGQPINDAAGKQISVPADSLKKIEAGRADRKFAMTAISLIELNARDDEKRIAAVRKCGAPPPQPDALEFLADMATSDSVRAVRNAAIESIALIHLSISESTVTQRIAAATTLGNVKAANAVTLLRERLAAKDITADEAAACSASIAKIESYQIKVKAFDSLKFGLSTGSILILMALGLSITFGLMGVINMAHGELMMIGAYATYSMQMLFKHTADAPNNLYFLTAIPVSFLAAALVGGLIEVLVVRHLYRRPLESLLATYGVSLILIQVCRVIFGDNRACNSPTWLVGSVELVRDMSLSYNRIFVFLLAAACLPAIWLLMNKTNIGLHMRATMQIRPMAASVGINTRRVDTFTFMLGSGLAGIAGCALTTIGGITPDMGQNYIVDSFLVVVTGGVGQLAGVVSSGLGLGLLTKALEGTFFGTVWAKILVLTAVIAFIQYKPSGLYALKGRLADD